MPFLNLLAEEAESPAGVLPLVEVVVLEDVGDVLGAAGGGRLGEGVRAHSGAPRMKNWWSDEDLLNEGSVILVLTRRVGGSKILKI